MPTAIFLLSEIRGMNDVEKAFARKSRNVRNMHSKKDLPIMAYIKESLASTHDMVEHGKHLQQSP
eukprot:714255-Rhodomonas_salina.1